jgi:hypothetical protein
MPSSVVTADGSKHVYVTSSRNDEKPKSRTRDRDRSPESQPATQQVQSVNEYQELSALKEQLTQANGNLDSIIKSFENAANAQPNEIQQELMQQLVSLTNEVEQLTTKYESDKNRYKETHERPIDKYVRFTAGPEKTEEEKLKDQINKAIDEYNTQYQLMTASIRNLPENHKKRIEFEGKHNEQFELHKRLLPTLIQKQNRRFDAIYAKFKEENHAKTNTRTLQKNDEFECRKEIDTFWETKNPEEFIINFKENYGKEGDVAFIMSRVPYYQLQIPYQGKRDLYAKANKILIDRYVDPGADYDINEFENRLYSDEIKHYLQEKGFVFKKEEDMRYKPVAGWFGNSNGFRPGYAEEEDKRREKVFIRWRDVLIPAWEAQMEAYKAIKQQNANAVPPEKPERPLNQMEEDAKKQHLDILTRHKRIIEIYELDKKYILDLKKKLRQIEQNLLQNNPTADGQHRKYLQNIIQFHSDRENQIFHKLLSIFEVSDILNIMDTMQTRIDTLKRNIYHINEAELQGYWESEDPFNFINSLDWFCGYSNENTAAVTLSGVIKEYSKRTGKRNPDEFEAEKQANKEMAQARKEMHAQLESKGHDDRAAIIATPMRGGGRRLNKKTRSKKSKKKHRSLKKR